MRAAVETMATRVGIGGVEAGQLRWRQERMLNHVETQDTYAH